MLQGIVLLLALGAQPVVITGGGYDSRKIHATQTSDGGWALEVYCVGCAMGGGGGGYSIVQEEGTSQTARSTLNLIGPAITATDDAANARTNVTIEASGVGACGANSWASTLNNGAAPTCTQPAFSNLSGSASASQLPAATASTLGAVKGTGSALVCTGTDKVTGFGADGTLQCGADQNSGGGGGAPTDAEYITYSSNATLSAERVLSNGTNTTVDTSTAGQVKINVSGLEPAGTYSGIGACGANTWASTLNDSAAPTCTQPAFSNLSGTATDAQLANNYSGVGACGANQWASTLNDNAAPTCTQPAFSNLSGAATIAQGGTTETASTEDAVLVGAGTTDWAAKVLPSCSNATTSKLLYDSSTNTFSCGTDQTAAGGGYTTVADEGTGLTARNTINFTGAGVSCVDNSGSSRTDCTISGGGSSTDCITFMPWQPCGQNTVNNCTVIAGGCVATSNLTSVGNKGGVFMVDMDRFTHAKLRYRGAMAATQTGNVGVKLRNHTDSTDSISTTWNTSTTCDDRSSSTTDLSALTGVKTFGVQVGTDVATDDPAFTGIVVEFCTASF